MCLFLGGGRFVDVLVLLECGSLFGLWFCWGFFGFGLVDDCCFLVLVGLFVLWFLLFWFVVGFFGLVFWCLGWFCFGWLFLFCVVKTYISHF